jgi:hypothetical protein
MMIADRAHRCYAVSIFAIMTRLLAMTQQTVIISFIGRGQRDTSVSGAPYVRTRYKVDHEAQPPDTSFYLNVLRHRYAPQRIHILGTRSSSWDALIDDLPLDATAMACRDALRQAADEAALSDAAPGVSDARRAAWRQRDQPQDVRLHQRRRGAARRMVRRCPSRGGPTRAGPTWPGCSAARRCARPVPRGHAARGSAVHPIHHHTITWR